MKGSQTKDNQLELRIKAKLENLAAISDFIAEAMKRLGIEQEISQVQLAVNEACTNIIQHAYSGESEKLIRIICSMSGNDLLVRIRDWGESFDPTSVPSPEIDSELFERQLGGLGIFLMRQMMDEVRYVFYTRKHNEVIMMKHISREA